MSEVAGLEWPEPEGQWEWSEQTGQWEWCPADVAIGEAGEQLQRAVSLLRRQTALRLELVSAMQADDQGRIDAAHRALDAIAAETEQLAADNGMERG